jgi:hypothetical protein
MIYQLELKDDNQLDAIRAFLKALKVKHTLKKDDAKMSKEAYFEMLDERIANTKIGKLPIISQEEQKAILFG